MLIEGCGSNYSTVSGLLIFKIIEGQLAHKDCYLEVLMDDMLFPAYSTSRIKSKNIKFDESMYNYLGRMLKRFTLMQNSWRCLRERTRILKGHSSSQGTW